MSLSRQVRREIIRGDKKLLASAVKREKIKKRIWDRVAK